MMEIGNGSSIAVQRTIASMGANNLMILPGTAASGGVSFGAGSVMTLTPQDADALAQNARPWAASPRWYRARTQVVYGNRNWVPMAIYGTTPAFLQVRDWTTLAEGEAFTDREVRNASKVCLIGDTLVRELFGGRIADRQGDPHPKCRLHGDRRAERKGANMMGMDQDDMMLAPWTTIKYRVAGASLANPNQQQRHDGDPNAVNTLNQLYPVTQQQPLSRALQRLNRPTRPSRCVLPTWIRFIAAARSAAQIPRRSSRLPPCSASGITSGPAAADDFNIRDMTEMTKAMTSTTDNDDQHCCCAWRMISLVVGGVGIMNIMLVSVTERTREIGLRMAVGAEPGDILRQFLLEAVVLCLIGGAVGIILGRSSAYLVSVTPALADSGVGRAIIAAVAVSASVGVLFGYYPAWKASRLDPIEALRYE